jgi:O-antigen ligase
MFILYDFRIGVVLLILLMPISSSHFFPHAMFGITGLNPLNLLLIGTLGSCALQGLSDNSLGRFVPFPLLWLYIVPILFAGVLGSTHVSEIAPALYLYGTLEFNDTAGYIRDLLVKPLSLVVFALLIAAAVSKSERPEKFLVPALISVWLMGTMVIVFVAISGFSLAQLARSESRDFLSPLGMHANDLGRLYAVAYSLLLFTWAELKKTSLKYVLLASMGLLIVALILTFSRGAFLAFIAVNVLFMLSHRKARTLVVGTLITAAILLLLPEVVYDRILTGQGEGLDVISAGRIEGIWLPLLQDILRSPIYGNGLGSMLWSEALRRGLSLANVGLAQVHNAYLETVLDMGIIGLVFMCAYFVHIGKGFRKLSIEPGVSPQLRGFNKGALAGLIGFLIAGIAGSYLTPRPEQVYLWLAIGMMYGQIARKAGVLNVAHRHTRPGANIQSA